MTLRDVIARLDEFSNDDTIYVETPAPDARAVVAAEPDDVSTPEPGLSYLLEVDLAREAIKVWCDWRPGRTPSLDDRIAAVTHYAEHNAWLPVD